MEQHDVNMPNREGVSPLSLACRFEEGYDIVELLILHGADINGTKQDRPLLAALSNANAFLLLLRNHSDPNVQTRARLPCILQYLVMISIELKYY